jgi:hypothetical protein
VTEPSLMLVFTRPVAGREEEYHQWYDHQHLADVARIPGVVSARRYGPVPSDKPDPEQADRYLAIYEIDAEPKQVQDELLARFGTHQMPASDALDLTDLSMTFWAPRNTEGNEA